MTLSADLQFRQGHLDVRIQLSAVAGETVALLGPNGAGKTSCLRALAGLLRLDHGRVDLDGETLEDTSAAIWVAPERRRTAMVFQQPALLPHLDTVDNVAFGLRACGVARQAARERAAVWLRRVGVEPRRGRRPGALSGGERQRVALAQALITAPRLLLLDEPLASVDPSARVEIRRMLRAELREHDGIRLLVTHDPLEAAALADRIVIVELGRVVQAGDFAAVTARPRSEWVARMVGVNLLHGEAGRGRLHLGEGTELAIVGTVTGPVLATIHPRAVALHRSRPVGSPRNIIAATVGDIDHQGDRWRVQLEGVLALVAEVTPAAAIELRLADGGAVFAAVKATEVDVYPA